MYYVYDHHGNIASQAPLDPWWLWSLTASVLLRVKPSDAAAGC